MIHSYSELQTGISCLPSTYYDICRRYYKEWNDTQLTLWTRWLHPRHGSTRRTASTSLACDGTTQHHCHEPGSWTTFDRLMNGVVSPEEFDCFHDLIVQQEFARQGQRGYGDSLSTSWT
ncbi:hypothetical protein L210DRAFT_3185786 [Boletus edulis BED1]|uniref:Uncharacterized protein n=1 Tax=Boletus edulis BED1 TaxID=1328754 RepID=A0AAD4BG79_BOLED|nr:hypothetical protein L210DRAFT_3185786 [Boletus edulis BED1]